MELQSANFQAEKQPETTPSDQVHCQRNNDIEIIPNLQLMDNSFMVNCKTKNTAREHTFRW